MLEKSKNIIFVCKFYLTVNVLLLLAVHRVCEMVMVILFAVYFIWVFDYFGLSELSSVYFAPWMYFLYGTLI